MARKKRNKSSQFTGKVREKTAGGGKDRSSTLTDSYSLDTDRNRKFESSPAGAPKKAAARSSRRAAGLPSADTPTSPYVFDHTNKPLDTRRAKIGQYAKFVAHQAATITPVIAKVASMIDAADSPAISLVREFRQLTALQSTLARVASDLGATIPGMEEEDGEDDDDSGASLSGDDDPP